MANPEHLAKLKEGVEAWNAWREEQPDIKPDLGSKNSSEVRFEGDLFVGYSLQTTGSDLAGLDFTGANFVGTNFGFSNLYGTNLRKAGLIKAEFFEANLNKVDLSSAVLRSTIFVNSDLSQARGLDTCIHLGPSIIDHNTILKSGKLPEVFLRGCGLPDRLIEYYPSLLKDEPIQFYSCFISYSTKDEEFAERLHADLQAKGVRCWFAPHDLKTGDEIRETIDQQIRVREKLLVIFSDNSINSEWVKDEVNTAFEEEGKRSQQGRKDKVLFPIRLDDSVLDVNAGWARKSRDRLIADFTHWKDHDSYMKAFDRLLKDLKASG